MSAAGARQYAGTGPETEEDPMPTTEVCLNAYDVAMENFDTAWPRACRFAASIRNALCALILFVLRAEGMGV